MQVFLLQRMETRYNILGLYTTYHPWTLCAALCIRRLYAITFGRANTELAARMVVIWEKGPLIQEKLAVRPRIIWVWKENDTQDMIIRNTKCCQPRWQRKNQEFLYKLEYLVQNRGTKSWYKEFFKHLVWNSYYNKYLKKKGLHFRILVLFSIQNVRILFPNSRNSRI